MSKFKFNGVIVGLFLLLGGCSSGMQSNNASSSDVGTAWGGDVHSSVQSVSVERADREPAEMVVINYSTQYPSGYDKFIVYVSAILNMLCATLILIPFQLLVATTHQWDNGNIVFLQDQE